MPRLRPQHLALPSGGTLHWQEAPGAGDPLLLLHGLGGAATVEFPMLPEAPGLSGRRTLLIDLPGFGLSRDAPQRGIAGLVDGLEALVTHLRAKRFALMGHSMGGLVALLLAARHPERISALCLAEGNLAPGHGQLSRGIAAIPLEDWCAGGRERVADRLPAGFADTFRQADPAALWHAARDLDRGTREDWRALFSGLKMPRSYLIGERSNAWNLDWLDLAGLQRAGIAIRTVTGAGHFMAQDAPAALAAQIAAALDAPQVPVTVGMRGLSGSC
ncbi:alpha/beta hydrolase [Pseudooceanicola sp. CBS1P-1]|uniref:Alpha/beta fold hydrolase n=1 Tax=Pseudooceanicola albus TaxID=2692189 RepID=A0A6L7G437_9RHOB|nr:MULTISPECIES: alpha/beta fold hydrolase [Pseudooceanicola]MBT9385266.1 alpha/beta hydrolase [Pseudooceanicola endophyticus]MXN18875.1 alpha/beta fold hydrolase [Pseudooceanicola albus]